MKGKRFYMGYTIITAIIIVAILFMFGCNGEPTTTNGEPTTPATKTLKIGLVVNLGWSVGLNASHQIETMVDMDNANGGLTIGGEQYNVELILYDSTGEQATEVAAVNRLIYEDNVSFIMSDGTFLAAWLPTAEAEKVIVLAGYPDYQTVMVPENHYYYNPTFIFTGIPIAAGWYASTFPEKTENIVIALPDNVTGQMTAGFMEMVWGTLGVEPTMEYYPADSQDLSALGTKIKTLNPDTLCVQGGGAEAPVYKAARDAGYEGQFFLPIPGGALLELLQEVSADVVEGLIYATTAAEFDPPLIQYSEDFKAAYIAEYGESEWTGRVSEVTACYACLRAALPKAGSLDTDEVAAVISDSLAFDGPTGSIMMVSRPEIGNYRTIDSVMTLYIAQVQEGKAVLFDTMGIDDGIEYLRLVYPAE